ncbi:MarR family transcriptional regulator [Paenibacillus glycanilyticus]|uniref:MarR family winged helix-turn-helix transcriptional regulator n=1 Tax=Paenibacillus glycanilyticus TaxID=126569 RepID=UPI00203CAAB1|nr:MarR family transcriptional regulator [Paenibacillus glycanilyticus]MCM3627114.1 MarR family transcriptional regulator [Paenibacillus glycanilyticus]
MAGGEEETAARKLIEVFMLFNKMNWNHQPLDLKQKHSELRLLVVIKRMGKGEEEGIKVSDLSKFLRVTSPTVTQLLNRLEEMGLVVRKEDPKDRRAVRVFLTEEGDLTAKKALKGFLDRMNGLIDYLGEDDTEQLIRLLKKTTTYFEQMNLNDSGGDD